MPSNLCGCKGIRCCALCNEHGVIRYGDKQDEGTFFLCNTCCYAFSGTHSCNVDVDGLNFQFSGVTVVPNFITEDEEEFLLSNIDANPWVLSQSGRRKQDYGPKVNFKRQRVDPGRFSGLPSYCKFLLDRINKWIVANQPTKAVFDAVELCNLEYMPDRGACIVPHLDDVWLWGDRLITLNICSPTILRFTLPSKETSPEVAMEHKRVLSSLSREYEAKSNICVKVPLYRRSLVIVDGPARYIWFHEIRPADIESRRIAMTFRELSTPFVPTSSSSKKLSSDQAMGQRIIELAKTFTGSVSNR